MQYRDRPDVLEGRVALVTGASKGIGAGIATAMAAAGAAVVVNYASDRVSAETVVAAIESAGGRAHAIQADVGRVADVERLLTEGKAALGAIDIVVNNASVFGFAPLADTSDERLQTMIGTNLLGTIYVCREAMKHFPETGGSIVNIGSMASVRYSAGATAYAATKAAVTGVTGVLAVELAPRHIRVNQINPGAIDTEGARAVGAMSEASRAAHVQRTPLGRIGTPADIASIAVFLASDAASWVTGEVIAVSGGLR
jgi:3-oxoacyl-[acyl-carrier protein] reductase